MKKWCVFALVMIFGISLLGCGQIKPKSLMSEQTKIVFCGQGEKSECLISVGEREEPYVIDGKHCENVPFSLVVLKPASALDVGTVEATLCVNAEKRNVELELNPLNMTFVTDLGYAIPSDATLSVEYQGESYSLKNISDEFFVQYDEAINIGIDKVNESGFFEQKQENFECYLKIIEGEKFGKQGYFWYFSLVTETNQSKNVLIGAQSKEIILG